MREMPIQKSKIRTLRNHILVCNKNWVGKRPTTADRQVSSISSTLPGSNTTCERHFDRVHHLFRNKWKGSTKLSSYDPDCSLQFDQKLPGIVTDADWEGLRDEIGSKVKCQKVKLVEEDMQGKTFFYGSNPKTHFDTNTTKPSLILPSTSETELDQSESKHLFCVGFGTERTNSQSFIRPGFKCLVKWPRITVSCQFCRNSACACRNGFVGHKN